jgi:porin
VRLFICAGVLGLVVSVSASAQTAPGNATQPDLQKASVATLAPALLPYFNNGPVFGLPGTEAGGFRRRTQLTGDWGGRRTELARRGWFLDLYSTSAYQNVASGGLTTGMNTALMYFFFARL